MSHINTNNYNIILRRDCVAATLRNYVNMNSTQNS